MPEYQSSQVLTELKDDVPVLVAEMKRLAGVTTDRDLATFLGVAQSTVSHWRKRGQVPEASILRFEQMIAERKVEPDSYIAIAARMVAMAVADHWIRSMPGETPGRREIAYGTVAVSFSSITDSLYSAIEKHSSEQGLDPWAVAAQMLEDGAFLDQVVDWVRDIPAGQAIAREMLSPPTLRR